MDKPISPPTLQEIDTLARAALASLPEVFQSFTTGVVLQVAEFPDDEVEDIEAKCKAATKLAENEQPPGVMLENTMKVLDRARSQVDKARETQGEARFGGNPEQPRHHRRRRSGW